MDAKEIARLREKYNTDSQVDVEMRRALAALEQAQKEQAESKEVRASTLASYDRAITNYGHVVALRDVAQQDAKDARALLRNALWFVPRDHLIATELRARIEVFLEKH